MQTYNLVVIYYWKDEETCMYYLHHGDFDLVFMDIK